MEHNKGTSASSPSRWKSYECCFTKVVAAAYPSVTKIYVDGSSSMFLGAQVHFACELSTAPVAGPPRNMPPGALELQPTFAVSVANRSPFFLLLTFAVDLFSRRAPHRLLHMRRDCLPVLPGDEQRAYPHRLSRRDGQANLWRRDEVSAHPSSRGLRRVRQFERLVLCARVRLTVEPEESFTATRQFFRAPDPEHPLDQAVAGSLLLGLFCDFAVVCRGRQLPCHKAILSNRSPVFGAMLSSPSRFREAREGVLVLDDVEPEVARDFLYLVYAAHDLLTAQILDVVELADRYMVPVPWKGHYCYYSQVLTQLEPATAARIARIASLYSLRNLEVRAAAALISCGVLASSPDLWLRLPDSTTDLLWAILLAAMRPPLEVPSFNDLLHGQKNNCGYFYV